MRFAVVLLLAALVVTPMTASGAPLAQTLPEPAIPQATLDPDWKVTQVSGPTAPHEIYTIELENKGKAVFSNILIGKAEDTIEALAVLESARADIQSHGFQLPVVEGSPGDGAAYRGIMKQLLPGFDVQATVVIYIARAGPRFTQITTFGIEVPEKTLYDLNARLIAQQLDRFRALTPTQPTPAPAPVVVPTPTPLPLDAQALALPPRDLGPTWVATNATGDAQNFMAEYFNGTVDSTGFGLDRLLVEPLSSAAAADARIQWWRDGLQGQQATVVPWSGLGDGDGVRYSVSDQGLKSIGFVYRVGPVVVVSRAMTAATSSDTTIETEALRLANLQRDRIQRALTGQTLERSATLSKPALPDPTELVLKAEALGEGWSSLNVDSSGSAEQAGRSVTITYGNESTYSTPRSAFLRVALSPDTARARVGFGFFLADGVAQNFQYVPVSGLGDETAFQGTQVMDDGRITVEYVYRIGPAVVSTAFRSTDASIDELSQQAWDTAIGQQQRVLDVLPSLTAGGTPQSTT